MDIKFEDSMQLLNDGLKQLDLTELKKKSLAAHEQLLHLERLTKAII